MKKIFFLKFVLLAISLWFCNTLFASTNYDFVLKEVEITHGEKLQSVNFKLCNYWDTYRWEISFIILANSNKWDAFINEFSFNYNIYEKLFNKWECKKYNIDSVKLRSIVWEHNLDKNISFYWFMRIVWVAWTSWEKMYPDVWVASYHTYNNGDERNHYYLLIEEIYDQLLKNNIITLQERNIIMQESLDYLDNWTLSPREVYERALGTEKKYRNIATKEKYSGLIKKIYDKLYQTWRISFNEYHKLWAQSSDYLYNTNSDPEKLYNEALEMERIANITQKNIKNTSATLSGNNIYWISNNTFNRMSKMITNLPENKKEKWIKNTLAKIQKSLNNSSLTKKQRDEFNWLQLFLQDYLQKFPKKQSSDTPKSNAKKYYATTKDWMYLLRSSFPENIWGYWLLKDPLNLQDREFTIEFPIGSSYYNFKDWLESNVAFGILNYSKKELNDAIIQLQAMEYDDFEYNWNKILYIKEIWKFMWISNNPEVNIIYLQFWWKTKDNLMKSLSSWKNSDELDTFTWFVSEFPSHPDIMKKFLK